MSRFKLLALDLDGTLTNSEKKVSEKNKEYIRMAQEQGVKVALASGRPVIGIQKIADELDLWRMGGYILAYNGGHIIDCGAGADLVKRTIPLEYVHDICEVIRKFNAFPLTYNGVGVISESDMNRYVKLEAYNNGIPVIRVPNLEAEVVEPAVKFMVVGEPPELRRAYGYLCELLKGKLNVFFSEPYFMEITPLGIEKASALATLSEMIGITREEIIACGDGLNDIPMLEYAGLSVAMANAYDETKRAADCVVPATNDEDGVAEAIRRYIL